MEEYNKVTKEIVENVQVVDMLMKDVEKLESENEKMLNEIETLKENISKLSEDENDLLGRCKAIKLAVDVVDTKLKEDNRKMTKERKKLLKIFAIQITQNNETESEGCVEFNIHFKHANEDYHITLAYDTITEDYELISLNPPHNNFNQLKHLLSETRDIHGFVVSYRKYISRIT